MVHVLFWRERSIDESNGIRKDARSFEIAFEWSSRKTLDKIFEERALEMKGHPAHRLINRYLPKTDKMQQRK